MPLKSTQTSGVEVSLLMEWMGVVAGGGKGLNTLSALVVDNVRSSRVPVGVLDAGDGRLQATIGVRPAGQ